MSILSEFFQVQNNLYERGWKNIPSIYNGQSIFECKVIFKQIFI